MSTPVLGRDGNVWSQQETVQCDHNHTTPEAAKKCAEALARKATK